LKERGVRGNMQPHFQARALRAKALNGAALALRAQQMRHAALTALHKLIRGGRRGAAAVAGCLGV